MHTEPQSEHHWLQRLVGDWTYEGEAVMAPDQPPMKMEGTESVRSVGGLWTMGEGHSEMPDGKPAVTFMTLGYDPRVGRFVGTFIGSMMTHMWIYNGSLDAAGKVLTLDTEGPDFSGGPVMAKFQDIIEFISDDHRTLTARVQDNNGNWNEFMKSYYSRK